MLYTLHAIRQDPVLDSQAGDIHMQPVQGVHLPLQVVHHKEFQHQDSEVRVT